MKWGESDMMALRDVSNQINLLKTKRNLIYIRSQSVPRCKHFLLRFKKPIC